MQRQNAILTIILGTLTGWLIPTIFIKESILFPGGLFYMFYYEQIAGMLLGFFFGTISAIFIGEKTSLQIFFTQVKRETFSFMGLGIALVTFFLNVIIPRTMPMYVFSHVTPQGEIITPSEAISMNFSIALSMILLVIIIAIIYKIKKK